MDKSATFLKAFKDARDLFSAGMYHKALSKFETALTVAQDEKNMIDARFSIIDCYERLVEVSGAELVGLGRRAHDFCSLSMKRCCVGVTSWSQ
jgi:hypothetical protein